MKITARKDSKTTGGEAAFAVFQTILPREQQQQKKHLGENKDELVNKREVIGLAFHRKTKILRCLLFIQLKYFLLKMCCLKSSTQ